MNYIKINYCLFNTAIDWEICSISIQEFNAETDVADTTVTVYFLIFIQKYKSQKNKLYDIKYTR